MKLQHIELSKLKLSSVNVRKHGGKQDLDELIASIRSLGVIQPLLVRPNCEGFEVVAGQRRMMACQVIEAEDGKIDPLPCAVLGSGDDAVAIEASLAENVSRLPMDEIDQYRAFASLKAKGDTTEGIAARFGVTELLVRKWLAIANLIPQLLTAYRKEEIDMATLRLLTLATKQQQKEWLAVLRDPEECAPTGARLKAWLFGAEIPVSAALFPLDQYQGNIVSDLFGDRQYFDDADKFWKLQDAAIAERHAAYIEAGWPSVEVLEVGKGFYGYDMARRDKKDGGRVYISRAYNGEVEFYEGYLPEKDAAKIDRAREKAEALVQNRPDPVAAFTRPELTKAAMRYLDLHRHNAVRNELLGAPQIALRLMLASAITGTELWDVKPETQSANSNKAIASSVEGSKAQAAFDAERQAVRELLGLSHKDGFLIRPSYEMPSACDLFARLLHLSDKQVMRVLGFFMAETLAAGTPQVEAIGHLLEVDVMKWWSPDEAFFELLRDKQAINAILAEVGGDFTARVHLSDTAKVQKGQIVAHLTGDKGHRKVTGWKPRYMRFPMQPYTKRGDLPAVTNWNAVKKFFAKNIKKAA